MKREVCAIVGGGEGLGRALAATFARNGCDLALVSRTPAGSAAALAAAEAEGARVAFEAADATHPAALEAALGQLAHRLGEIDVLIYNARGGYESHRPLDLTYAQLEDIFRLEVLGAFAAAKAVMPGMLARRRGTVLFSSATAAFRGSADNMLFAIGKFGLRGLSQSLAKAYARDGIHVAHMRLDCNLDVPLVREFMGEAYSPDDCSNTDDVAETYWWVHRQPRSAWSNEVELRPFTERWTY